MHGREHRHGHHQEHQPLRPQHARLPQVHPAPQGQEHRGMVRKGIHQYDGLQGRGPNHHHGEPRAAGIAVAFAEREARAPVPLPAGQGAGQPQPLPRIHQGQRRPPRHRPGAGGGRQAHLPGVPRRSFHEEDRRRAGEGRHPHRRGKDKMVRLHHQQDPAK